MRRAARGNTAMASGTSRSSLIAKLLRSKAHTRSTATLESHLDLGDYSSKLSSFFSSSLCLPSFFPFSLRTHYDIIKIHVLRFKKNGKQRCEKSSNQRSSPFARAHRTIASPSARTCVRLSVSMATHSSQSAESKCGVASTYLVQRLGQKEMSSHKYVSSTKKKGGEFTS